MTGIVQVRLYPPVHRQVPLRKGDQPQFLKHVQRKDELPAVEAERPAGEGEFLRRPAVQRGRLPAQRRKNFQQTLPAGIQPRKHLIAADLAVDVYMPALQLRDIEIGGGIEKDEIPVPAYLGVRSGRNDELVREIPRRRIKQIAAETVQIVVKAEGAAVGGDEASP